MYKLVQTLSGHSSSVNAVAVSADGRKVVSGSGDETVKIWDAESGEELCTLSGHSDVVTAVAVSADGRKVVSGSGDETVKIWDAESGEELCTLSGHSDVVTAVAVSADGRKVVSGSYDNTVKIWDMIRYVPTKRVHELLMKTILNEDVIKYIMKFAVATKQELERKQQKTIRMSRQYAGLLKNHFLKN